MFPPKPVCLSALSLFLFFAALLPSVCTPPIRSAGVKFRRFAFLVHSTFFPPRWPPRSTTKKGGLQLARGFSRRRRSLVRTLAPRGRCRALSLPSDSLNHVPLPLSSLFVFSSRPHFHTLTHPTTTALQRPGGWRNTGMGGVNDGRQQSNPSLGNSTKQQKRKSVSRIPLFFNLRFFPLSSVPFPHTQLLGAEPDATLSPLHWHLCSRAKKEKKKGKYLRSSPGARLSC